MHLYAKKLNNSAASYIERGQHDLAISRLKKALHLIKQSSSNSDTNHKVTSKTTTEQVCCFCNYCSLDECMVYSEENAPYDGIMEHEERADGSRCEDYIHRRPIHFAPKFLLDEGHVMGTLLSLPIIFNLALAHHLKCVSTFSVSTSTINSDTATATTTKNNSTVMRTIALQKVLRLYELTYKLQTELISKASAICTRTSKGITDPGLRFDIIIYNNLSQVHKILQNHEKQKKCLQQLLSMLMYVVDMEHESYGSSSSSSSSSSNIIHEQEYPQASSLLSSSSASLATTMTAASLPLSRRGRKWLLMDLDGFLQNTSPIILQDDCAMAA